MKTRQRFEILVNEISVKRVLSIGRPLRTAHIDSHAQTIRSAQVERIALRASAMLLEKSVLSTQKQSDVKNVNPETILVNIMF